MKSKKSGKTLETIMLEILINKKIPLVAVHQSSLENTPMQMSLLFYNQF